MTSSTRLSHSPHNKQMCGAPQKAYGARNGTYYVRIIKNNSAHALEYSGCHEASAAYARRYKLGADLRSDDLSM